MIPVTPWTANKKAVMPPRQYHQRCANLGTGLLRNLDSGSEISYRLSNQSAARVVIGTQGERFTQTLDEQ